MFIIVHLKVKVSAKISKRPFFMERRDSFFIGKEFPLELQRTSRKFYFTKSSALIHSYNQVCLLELSRTTMLKLLVFPFSTRDNNSVISELEPMNRMK